MSKIDMRQTVEEAAHLFAESRSSGSVFPAYYHGFIAGAEWQAKQSPWVSVKDRLPPPGEEVLLFDINSIRHLVLGWLRENKGYNKSMWALSNGHVDDEDITHWMIIPENHG
jgi:hypothetical protein